MLNHVLEFIAGQGHIIFFLLVELILAVSKMEIIFPVLAFICFIQNIICQDDIIGCGGFVKSEVPLDFTQIKVGTICICFFSFLTLAR